MALLPNLGETSPTNSWTEKQIDVFAITTYLLTLAFCVGIILAINNLIKFMLTDRKNFVKLCKCQFFHPMLSFYIWIILDFVANIIYLILSVNSVLTPVRLVQFLPATFRVLIGIE